MTTIDGAIRTLEAIAERNYDHGVCLRQATAQALLDYIRGLEAKCAGPQVQGDDFTGRNT